MKKASITFDTKRVAVAVFPTAQETAAEVLSELAIKPYKAILVLLGSADSLEAKLIPRLTQLFSRGIARAAVAADAVLVDGGTQAGVMALLGEGVASRGCHSDLVGVAPAELVTYPGSLVPGTALEPHHSHFVLVEGVSWGSETTMLFELIRALSTKPGADGAPKARKPAPAPATSSVPALVLLVGGGPVTLAEVVRAVRQNLLIIVVAGSGGLADALAAAWAARETTPPEDPVLAEILADGKLRFYPLSGSVGGMEQLIVRELGADQVLLHAWEAFADYDHNANLQQRRFDQLQQVIILLGLAGTALAIGQQLYAPKESVTGSLLAAADLLKQNQIGWWLLHHLLILIPIALTVLITATNRFKQGTKWLLLRAGAEAIKREIYRYRVRAMYYKENAEAQLAQRLEDITRRTMRTEVNASLLIPYDKRQGFPPGMGADQLGDDGFGFLTPARYVEIRLGSQLSYFRRKAVRLAKQLKVLSWLTFIVGGVGTYLAAVGQQVWIALTTALVAAMGTYLGYRQTESTLIKYNQAATDLFNVRTWWNSLTADEQLQQVNIDLLVEHTEQVLQSEHGGWVQQMQNALAELHKNQAPAPEREENKEPQEATAAAPAPDPAPTPAAQPPPASAQEAPVRIVVTDANLTPAAASTSQEELTADAVLPSDDSSSEEVTAEDTTEEEALPAGAAETADVAGAFASKS